MPNPCKCEEVGSVYFTAKGLQVPAKKRLRQQVSFCRPWMSEEFVVELEYDNRKADEPLAVSAASMASALATKIAGASDRIFRDPEKYGWDKAAYPPISVYREGAIVEIEDVCAFDIRDESGNVVSGVSNPGAPARSGDDTWFSVAWSVRVKARVPRQLGGSGIARSMSGRECACMSDRPVAVIDLQLAASDVAAMRSGQSVWRLCVSASGLSADGEPVLEVAMVEGSVGCPTAAILIARLTEAGWHAGSAGENAVWCVPMRLTTPRAYALELRPPGCSWHLRFYQSRERAGLTAAPSVSLAVPERHGLEGSVTESASTGWDASAHASGSARESGIDTWGERHEG
jgi:hypothetical protein